MDDGTYQLYLLTFTEARIALARGHTERLSETVEKSARHDGVAYHAARIAIADAATWCPARSRDELGEELLRELPPAAVA